MEIRATEFVCCDIDGSGEAFAVRSVMSRLGENVYQIKPKDRRYHRQLIRLPLVDLDNDFSCPLLWKRERFRDQSDAIDDIYAKLLRRPKATRVLPWTNAAAYLSYSRTIFSGQRDVSKAIWYLYSCTVKIAKIFYALKTKCIKCVHAVFFGSLVFKVL